jgi:hypothetical protein
LISGKPTKVTEYYRKQKKLLEGFNEMEAMDEAGGFPGSLTEVSCFGLIFPQLLI